MNKLMVQGGVLILMLLALPLTSLGTTTPADWAVYLGLGTITVGGLTMPVLHFVGDDDEDGENEDEDGDENEDENGDEANEEAGR